MGLRALSAEIGEVKRLFVGEKFRRRGAGLALMKTVMSDAREAGYRQLALDTLPSMESAMRLYKKLGFMQVNEPGPGVLLDPNRLRLRL